VTDTRYSGTGIFNAPSTVISGTGSRAVALIFWAVGGVYALAASHLYMEFGLNVPRYVTLSSINGAKEGVPRSGGELNYVCSFFVPMISSSLN